MKINPNLAIIGTVALASAGLIWWLSRPGNATRLASSLAESTVKTAGNAAVGAYTGALHAVGVPYVDADKCKQDLAAGRMWAAMSSCDVVDYAKAVSSAVSNAVFGSTTISTAQVADVRRIDNSIDRAYAPANNPNYSYSGDY
jgi:hypothetical protein